MYKTLIQGNIKYSKWFNYCSAATDEGPTFIDQTSYATDERPIFIDQTSEGRLQGTSANVNDAKTAKVTKKEQEGHHGPEVAHLYIGPRSGASLNPRAFI
jgi:hypothetical protein